MSEEQSYGLRCDDAPALSTLPIHVQTARWRACIQIHGRSVSLGRFDTEEAAAHAYDVAAIEAWGEFARTNLGAS